MTSPLADVDPSDRALVDLVLAQREMTATRALLRGMSGDLARLLKDCRAAGLNDLMLQALDISATVSAAFREVEAMEMGCGRPEGECVCPCHLGVRSPAFER